VEWREYESLDEYARRNEKPTYVIQRRLKEERGYAGEAICLEHRGKMKAFCYWGGYKK